MKIPKTFELMGETITVEYVQDLIQEEDALGQACFRLNKIRLLESSPNFKITLEQQTHTFLHELIHWILFKMNKEELVKDENFVDMFSDLLLQTMKSAKSDTIVKKVKTIKK